MVAIQKQIKTEQTRVVAVSVLAINISFNIHKCLKTNLHPCNSLSELVGREPSAPGLQSACGTCPGHAGSSGLLLVFWFWCVMEGSRTTFFGIIVPPSCWGKQIARTHSKAPPVSALTQWLCVLLLFVLLLSFPGQCERLFLLPTKVLFFLLQNLPLQIAHRLVHYPHCSIPMEDTGASTHLYKRIGLGALSSLHGFYNPAKKAVVAKMDAESNLSRQAYRLKK